MSEVRHALTAIDGYPARFQAMTAAQQAYDHAHPQAAQDREHHQHNYSPPSPALTPAQSTRLRRDLLAAATRLLDRCLKEALIDLPTTDTLRESMTADQPSTR